ncbi:MAG TPA: isoprenylcysteine carboxylmethyltransferase family protein [Streptosporangiaceae bacterium]
MNWLVCLYPRGWRKRYGAEAAQLTAELVRERDLTPFRAALDLIGGAGLAWGRVLNRPGAVDLAVRNAAFTLVVPGLGGFWLPWWLAGRLGHSASPVAWAAVPVIAAGLALYAWCVWNFATVGRGTPGPWDAPSRFVAAGPYRWVRNPIYVAALLVVAGQAWLFGSLAVLAYAMAMAMTFHIFVMGYEERTLRRRFGPAYQEYRRTVPRWLARPPAHPQAS